jgi:hypothetical protein
MDLIFSGNAKIEGLLPSLGMSGGQYNIALAIFFVPYILAGMSSVMCMQTPLIQLKRCPVISS